MKAHVGNSLINGKSANRVTIECSKMAAFAGLRICRLSKDPLYEDNISATTNAGLKKDMTEKL